MNLTLSKLKRDPNCALQKALSFIRLFDVILRRILKCNITLTIFLTVTHNFRRNKQRCYFLRKIYLRLFRQSRYEGEIQAQLRIERSPCLIYKKDDCQFLCTVSLLYFISLHTRDYEYLRLKYVAMISTNHIFYAFCTHMQCVSFHFFVVIWLFHFCLWTYRLFWE